MTDIVTIGLNVDSSQVDKGTDSLDKFGKKSTEVESSTDKLNSSLVGMAAKVAAVGGALAATVEVIRRSVQAADDLNKSMTGLASIARYAGQDITATLNTALNLTKDGILSTSDAATALKNLLAKGFTTTEAVSMIERLKDAAAFGRQSTLSFAEAVVGATEGIKNENSMLIDNAGVTKNAAKMIDEYAKSIGKKSTALSEAEKRTALYNGILKETEGQIGNAALAADGLSGKQSALSKSINDTAITIGQAFMPAAIALVDALAKGFGFLHNSVIKPFLFLVKNIGITIGELTMKAGAFFELMSSPIEFFKNPTVTMNNFRRDFKAYGDIAEDERIRIAGEMEGMAVPNIGKDTGIRRTEVIDNSEAEKAAAKDAKIKERNDARAAAEAARQQAELEKMIDHQLKMDQAEAQRAEDKWQKGIEKSEREVAQIEAQFMTEGELLAEKYLNDELKLEEAHARGVLSNEKYHQDLALLHENYNKKTTEIKRIEDEKKAASEKALNQIMYNGKVTILGQIAGLMSMFAGKNKAFAIAAIAIEKGVAMAQTLISGTAAAEAAGAHAAVAGGLPAYLAARSAVMGMTYTSMGLIAATGIAQAANAADGGGGSVGTSASTPATATQAPTAQAAPFGEVAAPVQTREIRVTVDSDGPHSEGMRAFAKNLAETIKDMGGVTNLVIA